jgi:hypothetical protein
VNLTETLWEEAQRYKVVDDFSQRLLSDLRILVAKSSLGDLCTINCIGIVVEELFIQIWSKWSVDDVVLLL